MQSHDRKSECSHFEISRSGISVKDLYRKHGIGNSIFYKRIE